jgi:uncharacterized damage-inducible protein DinB
MTTMKTTMLAALAVTLLGPAAAAAQTVTSSLQGLYGITKTNIVATGQLLDEELYAFRPTDEVRSMGELLAHVAGAQYSFCSAAAGESNPNSENFEETRTTKAQILDALEAGFGYCDGVYASTSDDDLSRTLTFFGAPNTTGGVLAFNAAHNYEHYGNLVTYMRLNGIVPPSSR